MKGLPILVAPITRWGGEGELYANEGPRVLGLG